MFELVGGIILGGIGGSFSVALLAGCKVNKLEKKLQLCEAIINSSRSESEGDCNV